MRRACIAILLWTCSAPPQAGDAFVQVAVTAQTSSGQITRVSVTAMPAGVSIDLSRNTVDGTYSGTLNVPAGPQTVTASVFANGVVVATGSGTVTAVNGTTATLMITALDSTGPAPQPEHSPVITSLSASATAAALGGQVSLVATAMDADGDQIAYGWSASPTGCGTFSAPAAASTVMTAASAGTCAVTITATARGRSDARSVNIQVGPVSGPALVQSQGSGVDINDAISGPYKAYIRPTGAGNLLVVCTIIDQQSGFATPTDDKGNSWAAGPSINNGSENFQMYYAANVAAGTTLIQTAVTGQTPAFSTGWMHVAEFSGVATSSPADGTGGSVSSTTTSVDVTTTQAGDLLVACGMETNAKQPGLTTLSPGAGWTTMHASHDEGPIAEYKVGGPAGIETCNYTVSGSLTWETLCQPFKAAAAGTPQSTNAGTIVYANHYNVFPSGARKIAAPCYGNLMVLEDNASQGNISAISDTDGHTWTRRITTSNVNNGQGDVAADTWAAENIGTCTTGNVLTLAISGTPPDGVHVLVYNLLNMPTNPLDVTAQANGVNDNGTANHTGSPVAGVSITPTFSNGIMFCQFPIGFFDITGVQEAAFSSDMFFDDNNMDASGPGSGCTNTPNSLLSQDNGWVHGNYSSTAAIQLHWTNNDPGTCTEKGIGTWVAHCIGYATATSSVSNPTPQGYTTIQNSGGADADQVLVLDPAP